MGTKSPNLHSSQGLYACSPGAWHTDLNSVFSENSTTRQTSVIFVTGIKGSAPRCSTKVKETGWYRKQVYSKPDLRKVEIFSVSNLLGKSRKSVREQHLEGTKGGTMGQKAGNPCAGCGSPSSKCHVFSLLFPPHYNKGNLDLLGPASEFPFPKRRRCYRGFYLEFRISCKREGLLKI